LKYCDSIVKMGYSYSNQNFRNDFGNYDFAKDSIPLYLDSAYQSRIKVMDVKSPFDFRYNEDVRNYIYLYTVKIPSLISRALTIKELYFPLFEQLLDKYQVPLELKYLAIVESALNAQALSRAGAVGLWQFMPATGKQYGLNISSKVDDRMNPYKATEAACRHFVDLYKVYKDWNLVLAAYNAGSGTINKALKRAAADSVTDYWGIRKYLPKETQSYVPAFIAVNYAMTYYFAHNIQPRETRTLPYYLTDTVCISESISFSQLSEWLDVPVETIKMLNPQYKKNIIPQANTTAGNILCLPYNKVGEFLANEKTILTGIRRPKGNEEIALER
jgi:membrane-bound lytic murein transglycosylase D